MVLYSDKFNLLMIWDIDKSTIQVGTEVYVEAPTGLVASLILKFGALYVGTVE